MKLDSTAQKRDTVPSESMVTTLCWANAGLRPRPYHRFSDYGQPTQDVAPDLILQSKIRSETWRQLAMGCVLPLYYMSRCPERRTMPDLIWAEGKLYFANNKNKGDRACSLRIKKVVNPYIA